MIRKLLALTLGFMVLTTLTMSNCMAEDYLPITNIFPPQAECHTHGSNIAYFNDSLMTVWFHGDGERSADEVQIKGSVLNFAAGAWSEPFQIAYSGTGYPDINPALLFTKDASGKVDSLSVYWEKIYFHEWGGAEVHRRDAEIAKDQPLNPDSFIWKNPKKGTVINFTYPDDFVEQVFNQLQNCWPLKNGKFDAANLTKQQKIDIYIDFCKLFNIKPDVEQFEKTTDTINTVLSGIYLVFTGYVTVSLELTTLYPDSKFYHLGWETRSNPLRIALPNGKTRILLPLYSDVQNISAVAYSDDNGMSWTLAPMVSRSGIQPTLVQTEEICPNGNKKIVAFMRNNGGIINLGCALYSYSEDNGKTWSPGKPGPTFTNSSTSLGMCKLDYGEYKNSIAMIYNPDNNRKILELAISQDNGKTWIKKVLESTSKEGPVKYEYPSITQVPNGDLYISFTHTGEPQPDDQTIGIVRISPNKILAQNNIQCFLYQHALN